MSGSFGFKQEQYDISLTIGEQVLLPKVRETSTDTLVIADGFSCREQIIQTTGRQGIHMAEVMQKALDQQ
jgi:Fe-S oxidoreductase